MSAPQRGDIVILSFDPQTGHEQAKRRPALVLSPAAFNEAFGVAFVAPVTTKPRGTPFEVALPQDFSVTGAVAVQQLKALDWRARRARRIASAPADVVATAAEIVRKIVGSG